VDDETSTRELRALLVLAWPIALAQLGTLAMSLVDTAILGHVSTLDLAGASLGSSIGFASLTLGMGVATAVEPFASQALGAHDDARAWQALRANTRACLVMALPCVVTAFAVTLLLAPIGVDREIVTRARGYLLGQTPSMVLLLLFISTKAFLQSHRRTTPALVGVGVANVVNLVVCNLLVRGDDALDAVGLPALGLPSFGAMGAGCALSIATIVLLLFVWGPTRHYRAASAPAIAMREMLRVGAPIGLQMLAEYSIFTTVAMLAGSLGSKIMAAHQIALAMASFTYMGALGIASATAVRVGYAVGARRQPRRAGLLGIGVGAAFMLAAAVVLALVPRVLASLFSDDPAVVEVAAALLRIAAVLQLFDGIQVVAAGALRGAGEVRMPFLAVVGAHWLIGFPTAWVLGFTLDWGARGLWWGLTAGLVAASLALAARFVVITRRPVTAL
jgi:MATE family multidrug resistance protein